MHMDGPYITVGHVSLDKTFGGSLTQPTKSQFISQAALTSHQADMIHSIQCIQPFDKLVLALNTACSMVRTRLEFRKWLILNGLCKQIKVVLCAHKETKFLW